MQESERTKKNAEKMQMDCGDSHSGPLKKTSPYREHGTMISRIGEHAERERARGEEWLHKTSREKGVTLDHQQDRKQNASGRKRKKKDGGQKKSSKLSIKIQKRVAYQSNDTQKRNRY